MDKPLSYQRLTAIERRLKDIKGLNLPWRENEDGRIEESALYDATEIARVIVIARPFIAHAPQDVIDLLAEVRRLRALLKED